ALPTDVTAAFHRAWALRAEGKAEESRKLYQLAMRSAPKWAESEREQAWKLATSADAGRRNGRLARLKAEIVSQAYDDGDPKALDALAAAHAELGDFQAAVATQRQALAAAGDDTD